MTNWGAFVLPGLHWERLFLRRVLGFWGGFKAMGIPSGLEEDWGLGKNFGHRKGLGCG